MVAGVAQRHFEMALGVVEVVRSLEALEEEAAAHLRSAWAVVVELNVRA